MTASEMPERYNVSTILDANLEAGREAKAAIVGEYGEVSYERLLAMACAAGRALRALGVQREQRVLMVMDDTPAFPAVFLGAIRAGMVPVPVNPLFKAEDYRYLLADSEARVVVADADLLPKVAEALTGHPRAGPAGGGQRPPRGRRRRHPRPGRPAGRACRRAGPGPDPPRRRRLLAVQLRLHRPAQGGRPPPARPALHLPDLRRPGARIGEGDLCLSTTKLFHAYGLGNSLSFPFWVGATSVQLYGRPAPDRVLDAVERAPAEPAVLGPDPLQRHAGHPRGQAAGPVVGAAVRLGRRVAAGRDLAALARHLRPGHPRRHRLHRDAAHLLLQHRRPAAARVQRHGRARLRPQAARRRRPSRSPRARPATCTSAATAPWPATGASTTRPSGRCWATGSGRETATARTPTGSGGTRAGSTTCSRSAACGCRRWRWSRSWPSTRPSTSAPSSRSWSTG